MCMVHIYKSNKYRSMISRISQKQRNDRKIKTVKFIFFVKYILASICVVICSFLLFFFNNNKVYQFSIYWPFLLNN